MLVLTHIEGMANVNLLNSKQANRLEEIIEALHLLGFDYSHLGIRSSSVHIEQHCGRVDFWLDGDDFMANGSLKDDGAGVWWLQRSGNPLMSVA